MSRDAFLNALLFVVPLVSLLFALGEKFEWWDTLTGRTAAKKGMERFYSVGGYPKTWIYRDRIEDKAIFNALERRINHRTSNETVRRLVRQGNRPRIITVGGMPFQITGLEPGMKSSVYSEVHPILYIYPIESSEEGKGKAAQVATLGELSQWLENEQANRRFWIVSVLIGLLSLLVLFISLVASGR